MSSNYEDNIIFALTKDEVLRCANELGISTEQVTDDVIELVKSRVNQEFRHLPEIMKDILEKVTKCPLELVCFPSCFWWEDGKCTFPRKGNQEPKTEKEAIDSQERSTERKETQDEQKSIPTIPD